MEIDCLTLEIRILANCLYQKVMADMDDNITMHQGLILGYIITHNDRQVTQKEIEELFHIQRSTANHMFQLMEKNGYVFREISPTDARMRVICVTESGRSVHNKFSMQLQKFEKQLRNGFSEKELEMFKTMMRQIWVNSNTEV